MSSENVTTYQSAVYKELIISSKDRTNPNTSTPDNFTVNLPQPVSMTSCYLKQVIFPQSFYTIPYDGVNPTTLICYFVFTDLPPTVIPVYLPYGTYTPQTLASALQTYVSAQVSGFTATIDQVSGVIYISTTTLGFYIKSETVEQFRILQALGLAPADSNPYTSYNYEYPGGGVFKIDLYGLSPVLYSFFDNLYVKSNTIASLTYFLSTYSSGDAVGSAGPGTLILGVIPTTGAFLITNWYNPSDLRFQTNPLTVVTSIDIKITGEYDYPVDFNGVDLILVFSYY